MNKLICTIICLTTLISPTFASHKGRVFIDKNKNGIFDRDEKPMANVLVSDGLNVVKTAIDGSFNLPGHTKERFVFITTPSGYKTDNKHYLPIESNRPSYDFGLQPYAEGINNDGSHRFIHISDTEIFNTENHNDWIKDVRSYARNEQAAFIIHTGDLCYEKGLNEHIGLMNTTNMGCPVFYCIGNHDLVDGKYGEELYEKIYGPVYYSFEVGNTHYIVTPMENGDFAPSYTKEDVYQWLKNDLRNIPAGKPIVIFNHDLLSYNEQFRYGISQTEAIELTDYNLKAWIYGHWHTNFMRKQGKVYTISTGSLDKGGIDHSIAAFRVIDIDRKGDISSRLRYTYLDKHIEIASPGADGYPVTHSGAIPLTVNTYHSASPTKEVYYTCLVDGKRVFANRQLSRQTDWSWKDILYLSPRPIGKNVTIKVTALFNNGEKADKEIRFTYTSRKPTVQLTDNWSNLLGDPQHTGISKPVLNPPLKMAWTSNIGANIFMTSPVIYKGNIYIASLDEDLNNKGYIYAISGMTGDVIWKYPVHNSVKNSIAVADNLVFAQTAEGSLYVIKTEDGSLKWGKQLLIEGLPALTEGLVVDNGVIYAGTGNGLYAANAQTGERIWENKEWKQAEGSTATLTLGKGMLIGSAQWGGLYANDAQTGELKWHLNKNGMTNRASSATIQGNSLYVTSGNSLFIVDPLTGYVIVRKDFPFSLDVTSTPLVTDSGIFFGSVDKGLIAVDRETLEIKWEFQTEDALLYTAPYTRKPSATVETSPILSGNTIYFGASDGNLYGLDKDSGELVWKHSTGAPSFATMAVSGNTLIAVDYGGNIYAFTAEQAN